MAKTTLQIFKTGRHVPMNGSALSFSEADLKASAEAYNPALHEAPIVIGHPKDNGPAWGWIHALAFAEGSLEAEPVQVDPAFAEAVDAGRYKKMSASFYAPESPNNPVPGVYYLRHVGFLGAMPPSVKGLREVHFAEGEEGVVEFAELDSWGVRQVARLFRGLRDYLAGKFTLEDADRAVPSYLVENLEEIANRPDPEETDTGAASPAFSEDPMKTTPGAAAGGAQTTPNAEELAAQKTALDTREADLNAREQKIQEGETRARHTEEARIRKDAEDFAEGLAKEGKLAAADRPGIVELLVLAAKAAPVEFGEGDKKTTITPLETLKANLSARPKLVEFGEMGGGRGPKEGEELDPQAMAAKVVEFQESEAKAGRVVSVTDAFAAVMKKGDK
jgi:hypothetical protein